MDRRIFFDAVRKSPFGGSISIPQVEGTEAILDGWEARGLTDLRWLAYMLATAYHETAFTMRPIAEYGKGKGRKYGVPGKHGQVAYGRGYVQLTWDYNYEKADKELGLNGALTGNYELALRPDIAAQIMFRGMREGWFTGKKLGDYLNDAKTDWRGARRIINGLDKADTIAGYAKAFHDALMKADVPVIPIPDIHTEPPEEVVKPDIEPVIQPSQSEGFFLRFMRALWLAIKGE